MTEKIDNMRAFVAITGISLLVVIGYAVYVSFNPTSEAYSEVWLENYAEKNGTLTVTIGVANHEGEDGIYRYTINSALLDKSENVTVGDGEKQIISEEFDWPADTPNQRISILVTKVPSGKEYTLWFWAGNIA